MKEAEKDIYNNNIQLYSQIVRNKSKDKEKVLECLGVFEYFEDYEKCDDLLRILREITESEK